MPYMCKSRSEIRQPLWRGGRQKQMGLNGISGMEAFITLLHTLRLQSLLPDKGQVRLCWMEVLKDFNSIVSVHVCVGVHNELAQQLPEHSSTYLSAIDG